MLASYLTSLLTVMARSKASFYEVKVPADKRKSVRLPSRSAVSSSVSAIFGLPDATSTRLPVVGQRTVLETS